MQGSEVFYLFVSVSLCLDHLGWGMGNVVSWRPSGRRLEVEGKFVVMLPEVL